MVVRVVRGFAQSGPEGQSVEISKFTCSSAAKNALDWVRKIGVITKNVIALPVNRASSCSQNSLKVSKADNRNTSVKALLLLADDEDADLRFAMAENHNISRDVLKKLSEDPNPYVADRATKTLTRIELNDTDISSWRSDNCA